MLTWAAIALALLAWGAHGVVPPTLAAGSPWSRRAWRFAALPLGLVALLAATVSLAAQPDVALAAGRPRLGILAALALGFYLLVLPPGGAAALVRSGDALTLATSALLFAAARWMPARLRRPALLGATVLAALVLARAEWISAAITAQAPSAVTLE